MALMDTNVNELIVDRSTENYKDQNRRFSPLSNYTAWWESESEERE